MVERLSKTRLKRMKKEALGRLLVAKGGVYDPSKTKDELIDIYLHIVNTYSYDNKHLLVGSSESSDVVSQLSQTPFDTRKMLTYKVFSDVSKDEVAKYYVRYLGSGGIRHGHTSTPSGSAYHFQSRTWTEVKYHDFIEKYYVIVERSVKNEVPPVWECAVELKDGKFIVFFHVLYELFKDTMVYELKDFYGMTRAMIDKLESHDIKNIREFQNVPDQWIIENLGVDNVHLAYWRDKAKEAILREREEIRKKMEMIVV